MNAIGRFFPPFAARLAGTLLALTVALLLPAEASVARVKVLNMTVANDRRSAEVTVPADCSSVTIQRFQAGRGWTDVTTVAATPGTLRVDLPDLGRHPRLRAIGTEATGNNPHSKFPAAFYRGRHTFDPSFHGTSSGMLGVARNYLTPNAAVGAGAGTDTTTVDPVEADIWKTDGTTVYYFNQLRGLQVLDLANPADPRMVATLRLPAVGQDLYLLPGSGAERFVILLTRGDTDYGKTRFHVVRVAGGTATITQTRDLDGELMDSRLAGNRLFVLTTKWSANITTNSGATTSVVNTTLSEWLVTPNAEPVAAGETVVSGGSPIAASGPNWLAVAVSPPDNWSVSDVHVFGLSAGGTNRLTVGPVRTEGRIADKFNLQWSGGVLTTISQRYATNGTWSPTTVLETFQATDPTTTGARLGRLELAQGESLYATRFAGNKAYVVTYLRTDPLWVIDLSNPAAPAVAGQVAVPGWSSHLEPIGDLLFAIGWESGTVTASLFDVANPASPQLLRRLPLGAPGTYSEAAWDEKALKVLPDQGLALVPVTNYQPAAGESSSSVQLIDLDLTARDLRLRGNIQHSFEPRRSTMIGTAVVSISQRALVTADVSDRDHPAVLAEVMLAWPADRVFATASHLVHIENGNSWSGGLATARVTTADAPDTVLAETDLGDGQVVAAALRDGKLYIVRELPATDTNPAPLLRIAWMPAGSGLLALDIYDASALPALPLLGSCQAQLDATSSLQINGILWPQPNRPTLVIESQPYFFWMRGGPVVDMPVAPAGVSPTATTNITTTATPATSGANMMMPVFGWPAGSQPRLLVYDVSSATAPTAATPLDLGSSETTLSAGRAAADGLLVVGGDVWTERMVVPLLPNSGGSELRNTARVIEVPVTGAPVMHPAIDLPGSLFAVTELDHNGFLAFTQAWQDDGTSLIQASACDGRDAYLVAQLKNSDANALAAGGRTLFLATGQEVQRQRLDDSAAFVAQPALEIGWDVWQIRWLDGLLLGTSGQQLFAAPAAADTVTDWQFAMWGLNLDTVTLAPDGALLVPFGDYGTERLSR